MGERAFDVVVIGAGPAGEVCSGRLGEAGLAVALVERHLVAGECSYYACMPSKALLRPGELLAEVARVPGVAEAVTGQLDVPAVLARRDEVIHNLDDSSQLGWLEKRGIELVRGTGRLAGERRVAVGDDVLTARRAVVAATGSRTFMPPIDGLETAHAWTNREATTASAAPGRLVILGGGVVGVELAQAWASLGSAVSLLEAGDRLIAREEPFASQQVHDALVRHGVAVHLGCRAVKVERSAAGVTVELADGTRVEGDELLVASGRQPGTDDLGVETIGLEPGKALEVGDDMRAPGHSWLFAIGDVNGRAPLTHVGKYQARVAALNILGGDARTSGDGPGAPRVTFTDPQVAAVGLTLDAAREAGIEAAAYDVETSGNAGASFHGRSAEGTSRLVVDESRGVLVGATFTGPDVGEWLQAASIALVGEVPVERLWDAIPSFPTRSEVWLKLLEAVESGKRAHE